MYLADTLGLPLLDGGDTGVGVALVFHDGVAGEAPRDGVAVEPVGGKVRRDRFGKVRDRSSHGLHHFDETKIDDFHPIR